MLRLLAKDFRAHRDYLLLFVAVYASISLGFFLALSGDFGFEPEMFILIYFLGGMFASKLFVILDEVAASNAFIASLPITRNNQVLARYLSTFILTVVAAVVHLAVFEITAPDELKAMAGIVSQPAVWILPVILVIISSTFSYPLLYKFGMVRGALIYAISITMLLVLSMKITMTLNAGESIRNVITALLAQPAWLIIVQMLLLITMLLTISIFVSTRIFKSSDI